MKHTLFTKLYQFFALLTIVGLVGFAAPRSVYAAAGDKPAAKSYYIEIVAVKKNTTVTVKGTGFQANTDFSVRVGPLADFFKKYERMGKVNTGSTGNFTFNVTLPSVVKDVKLVTVRLDSADKHYSFNVFENKDQGTIAANPNAWLPKAPSGTPTTPTPTPTPTVPPVASNSCQIVSASPDQPIVRSGDYDMVWTVKNTGSTEWNAAEMDFRYVAGDKIHKRKALYDLPKTVKPGETIRLAVDMLSLKQAGTYKTEWVITGNLGSVCSLPLTVVVQ